MYAIIEDSGTQIRVSEGDVVKVALRDLPPDSLSLTFGKVLFVGGRPPESGQTATIGTPLVSGATVVADILGQERDEKKIIWKFRRRKNYKRKKGHRQDFLRVKITSIQA